MRSDVVRAKWDRLHAEASGSLPEPAGVLEANAHLLPPAGLALDLACGLGGNALFLAKRGFRVSAWDISPVAVARLSAWAAELGLEIEAEACDVEAKAFPTAAFEVVVASRFLCRSLVPTLLDSLKPGGLLLYQTYVSAKPNPVGPSNPDFLLLENELPSLFADLRLVFYREEARIGDLSRGLRDEAYFVGQKRGAA